MSYRTKSIFTGHSVYRCLTVFAGKKTGSKKMRRDYYTDGKKYQSALSNVYFHAVFTTILFLHHLNVFKEN